MNELKNLYTTIKARSNTLIKEAKKWNRELAGSKNYVTTPDLQHWTFGKSAGLNMSYHYNGGAAKQWLYRRDFINIFELPNGTFKRKVIRSFLLWANKVNGYPIKEKFLRDQKRNRNFELLVHGSLINAKALSNVFKEKKGNQNQEYFDEGFKNQITTEINKRNAKLVKEAKKRLGTTCLVCDFSFGKTYGMHGMGFIEMHHLHPMSQGHRKSTIKDLAPVCSNCHRMLHKGNNLLSIKELKLIIKKAKNKIT